MFDSNLVDHLLMIRKVSFDGFYWDLVHIFPSIVTVSYTHLDVYKRQPISCANAVGANTAEIASVDASKALNALIFNVFLLFIVTSFGNCH